MQIVHSPHEMQKLALEWRAKGSGVSFVPTMGALHEGHLTLLREARKVCDKLVLSIFVNPTQFSPTEDLGKYPRDKDGDLAKAKDCKVDAVFSPTDGSMYPEGYQTFIEVTGATKGLCGESRPTHFRGVATVVAKLLNIVQPNIMFLGEKDYQQLVAMKIMTRDLNMPVEVRGIPIVREADGLAMSSRNAYLSKDERIAALSLSRSLKKAQDAVKSGERNIDRIISIVKGTIESARIPRIEYIKICDAVTLAELTKYQAPARLLIAAHVGKTRLIDNCQI